MPYNQAHRYQEVEVKTATSVEIVVLLYDAAIAALRRAQELIAARDIAGRVRSINKVSSILTELQATLNFEAGGEIAPSLDRLYRYMRDRVFQANLHQDAAPLQEVARLLSDLRGAWAEVAQAEAGKLTHLAAADIGGVPSAPSLALAANRPGSTNLSSLNITA